MKIYRVLVRNTLWSGPGQNMVLIANFRSKVFALRFAKSKVREMKEGKPYTVLVEEFILKELNMEDMIKAFDTEDIMDLIAERNTIQTFKGK